GSGIDGDVHALTVYNGVLFAAGSFTTAGGVSAHHIARWNGTDWQPLGSGTNASVYALAVHGGDLIAAGFFAIAGGVVANNIARWDGSAWQPLGSGTGGDAPNYGQVLALADYGGELVAGGYFTLAGGASAHYIARWDGAAWQPLGAGC